MSANLFIRDFSIHIKLQQCSYYIYLFYLTVVNFQYWPSGNVILGYIISFIKYKLFHTPSKLYFSQLPQSFSYGDLLKNTEIKKNFSSIFENLKARI